MRRSGRVAGTPAEFYDEDNLYRSLGIDRLDAFSRRGTRCTAPDPERLAALRAGRGGAVGGAPDHPADGARPAAPRMDSGRGVRVQGGRVYDSRYGVTCHWCRQKTLEEHVQCTAPGCGGGRRLPVSFWCVPWCGWGAVTPGFGRGHGDGRGPLAVRGNQGMPAQGSLAARHSQALSLAGSRCGCEGALPWWSRGLHSPRSHHHAPTLTLAHAK